MNPRRVALAVGALTLVTITGCASASGTGAPSQTTIRLGAPNFITVAPLLTSTTIVAVPEGAPGAPVPGEQQYTVKAGDLVVRIARAHCVDPTPLAEYNQWVEGYNHPIFPGDVIKIQPGGCAPGSNPEATTAPAASPSVATSTTFDESAGGTYIVQDGDYLGGIAEKTGTTVEGIVAANGWASAQEVIIPGQRIKLPAKTG